jgi:hypothetical protein
MQVIAESQCGPGGIPEEYRVWRWCGLRAWQGDRSAPITDGPERTRLKEFVALKVTIHGTRLGWRRGGCLLNWLFRLFG